MGQFWHCTALLWLPREASWWLWTLKVFWLQNGMLRKRDLDTWRHSLNKALTVPPPWGLSVLTVCSVAAENPGQSSMPDQEDGGAERQDHRRGLKGASRTESKPHETNLLPWLCYVGFQPKPRSNCAEVGGLIVGWRSPKIEDSRMLMRKDWWWSP